MEKRITALVISVLMIILSCTAAFADTNSINASEEDILIENADTVNRSTSVPKSYYNLNQGRYQFSADTFRASLFTNYYFTPNKDGKLTVYANMTVDSKAVPTQLSISVLSLDTKNYVSGKSVSNTTTKLSSGKYSTYVTVSKTFTGLDPNKFYFTEINKTPDGEYAKSMRGYVSW